MATATSDGPAGWRRSLRRNLIWSLLAKLAALTLLWALFFSPAHREPATAAGTGARLGLEQPSTDRHTGLAQPDTNLAWPDSGFARPDAAPATRPHPLSDRKSGDRP